MPILFYCPGCGREIRVRSASAGRKGHCADCGQPIQVPDLDLNAPPRTPAVDPALNNSGQDMPILKSGFVEDGK
jgi:hypothetical protein